MTDTIDLEQLHLEHGSHKAREQGVCLMEAVAWFAGEPHSDQPTCVSPFLRRFGIRLNDLANEDRRQDLVRFVPRVVGTAGDGLDEIRRWLAADHVVRVSVPRWLDKAGLTEQASALRGLPVIRDLSGFVASRPTLDAARRATYELRSARRELIRTKVREAVAARLAEAPAPPAAVAVAAAVAAAAAAAVADAVADAVAAAAAAADAAAVAAAAADAAAVAAAVAAAAAAAVAVAAAAADAVAAAAAAAAAAAVADAVADAAAVADAVAVADPWALTYKAVYEKVRPIFDRRYAAIADEAWGSALDLFDRLISPAVAA